VSEDVAESRRRPSHLERVPRGRTHNRPRPGSSGWLFRGFGRSRFWGGDQQYTVAAAVAVTCCSSRSAVGDRSDQHITVVATAMVCCPPWPSPSVTTGSCRDGLQRCSPFAEQRSVPSRPRRDGGYAHLLRRGTISTVAYPVERSHPPSRGAPTGPPRGRGGDRPSQHLEDSATPSGASGFAPIADHA
jgi:hypothetical protein